MKAATREQLLAAANIVRAAIRHKRSDKLLRLFDYLLVQTFEGKMPTELQIANEVFAKGGMIIGTQDANVRVYVHRLRKLMREVFASSTGPHIIIPVGEYRIRLVNNGMSADNRAIRSRRPMLLDRLTRETLSKIVAVILASAVFGAAVIYWPSGEAASIERSIFWRSLDTSDRPLILVVGDYYLFEQAGASDDNGPGGPRLVWDRGVPTREDLTILQMLSPDTAHTMIDTNQHYVTSGTIAALGEIRAAFAQIAYLRRKPVQLITSSQLTPEMLISSDIIYVGLFDGMNVLLREPLFRASGFEFDGDRSELIDSATTNKYRSDGMVLTDERISRRDFGYVATIPGPAQNKIIVIAGLGDAGLKEVAELVRDPNRLTSVQSSQQKREKGFENLYRVRTVKNANVSALLVLDRPLQSSTIWDQSGSAPAYRPIGEPAIPAVTD